MDMVEECYRALGRAVELSGELALGSDVVVAACPKSPRSKSEGPSPICIKRGDIEIFSNLVLT